MKKTLFRMKEKFVWWILKDYDASLKKDIAKHFIERDTRISELENYMRLVKSTTNIGIDLQQPDYGRSWVAVCIRGEKQQWVQFFDGSDQAIKEIQRNFRDMERARVIVDGHPRLRAKDFWF